MDSDFLLTLGIVVAVLSLPSFLAAWSDRRPPLVGGILLLSALLVIFIAFARSPEGYAPGRIPEVMLSVLGRALR